MQGLTVREYVEARKAEDPKLRDHHIAAELGVSVPYFSQILNGSRLPSPKLMLRIEAMTGGIVPMQSWSRMASAA